MDLKPKQISEITLKILNGEKAGCPICKEGFFYANENDKSMRKCVVRCSNLNCKGRIILN